MSLLKTELTRVTADDVAEAFVAAVKVLFPEGANANLVAVMLAHSALETGHWKVMRNFNFGNVKSTTKWITGGGDYVFYEASENLSPVQLAQAEKYRGAHPDGQGDNMEIRGKPIDDGGDRTDGKYAVWFWGPHPQARFRGFRTFAEGAASYMRKLTGRYRSALAAASKGDPAGYVRAIHSLGYFTAGLDEYSQVVVNLYAKYHEHARHAWQQANGPITPELDPEDFDPPPPYIEVHVDHGEDQARIIAPGGPWLGVDDMRRLADELNAQADALAKQLCLDHQTFKLEPRR